MKNALAKGMLIWFGLAALFALLTLSTQARAAGVDTVGYKAVVARFEGLVAKSTLQGEMPRLSNPEAADVIVQLSDRKRFLQAQTYVVRDIDALLGLCGGAFRVMLSYGTFNPDSKADAKIDESRVGKNFAEFSPELSKLHPFIIQCYATVIPLLTEMLQSRPPDQLTEKNLNGLKQTRSGIVGMFNSAMQAATTNEISDEYRLAVMAVTAETASTYTSAIPLPTRTDLIARAQKVPVEKGSVMDVLLKKIVLALQSTTCEGLCAIGQPK